jgi:hypothetical protein
MEPLADIASSAATFCDDHRMWSYLFVGVEEVEKEPTNTHVLKSLSKE